MSEFPLFATPCNCLALRQAMRQVTQLYDHLLAPAGLRITQYSILSNIGRLGPASVGGLAERLVMDRTTLTRNLAPLRAQGLVEVARTPDGRRREIRLTSRGEDRLREARPLWSEAQRRFEQAYGEADASALRTELQRVVTSAVAAASTASADPSPAVPP